jgi:NAD(P)-dependent dehydrogenase (short-subunit alcohol dehydrogenase family)
VGNADAKRVVVVGASTGLGRCIGVGLAHRGAQVALLARRRDKLDDAVTEAGSGAIGIECDAIDPVSCRAAIDAAAAAMGGIDSVIYAAAVGPLVKLEDATPDEWTWAFSTNVIGASNVTQAALPYIKESAGTVIYMSTTGASYTPPWSGLGVYQVTKAAMNRLVDHWHVEQPGVGFTLVTIGECPGGEGDYQTQFNVDWDMELMAQIAGDWFDRQLMSGAFIDIEHLVEQFHALVNAGGSLHVRSMVIIPRPPVPTD